MDTHDAVDLVDEANQDFLGGNLNRPILVLNRKENIIFLTMLGLRVAELQFEEMRVLLQIEEAVGSPDGVAMIGFELR